MDVVRQLTMNHLSTWTTSQILANSGYTYLEVCNILHSIFHCVTEKLIQRFLLCFRSLFCFCGCVGGQAWAVHVSHSEEPVCMWAQAEEVAMHAYMLDWDPSNCDSRKTLHGPGKTGVWVVKLVRIGKLVTYCVSSHTSSNKLKSDWKSLYGMQRTKR